MTGKYDLAVVCGGTGGHVFPALAVAEAFREASPGRPVLFIVKRRGFEEDLFRRHGFDVTGIRAEGFQRGRLLRNLRLLYVLPLGFLSALSALRASGARLVFSTGGYTGVPVLFAALLLRRKIALQEQNAFPGVTVRFFARFASKIFLAYSEAGNYLPARAPMTITGNPLRVRTGASPVDLRARHGLSKTDRVLFVVGGSQGSMAINRIVAACAAELTDTAGTAVFWQTGRADHEAMAQVVRGQQRVWLFPFIENIYDFYAAADLCLCRAGAMTLAELARFGLPAILIPLPSAAEDHQTRNARAVEAAGAGICMPQDSAAGKLSRVVRALLADADRLSAMRAAMKALDRGNAAPVIAGALNREIEA